MSKLTPHGRTTQQHTIYAVGHRSEPLIAHAVRTDIPTRLFLSYPVAYTMPDGTVTHIDWNWQRLHDALLPILTRIHALYGGNWHLTIDQTIAR